ncbi:hypothetical protein GQ457_05G031020 [Hibiscus cannabinus]
MSFSLSSCRFNSFVNDEVVKCFSVRQDSSSNSLVVVTEMLAGSTKSKCFLLPCKRSFLRLPGFCNIVVLLILFGEVLLFKTEISCLRNYKDACLLKYDVIFISEDEKLEL